MDKAILKKFAIESRQDLMEKIKNKVNELCFWTISSILKIKHFIDNSVLKIDSNVLLASVLFSLIEIINILQGDPACNI